MSRVCLPQCRHATHDLLMALPHSWRAAPVMSRNKVGKAKGGQLQPDKPEAPTASYPAFLRPLPDNAVSLSVHAKPGAKACSVSIAGDMLSVAVKAPAREGEANAGIMEYVADVLQMRKRDVTLAAGSKSREKVVRAQGIAAEEALARLQAAASGS